MQQQLAFFGMDDNGVGRQTGKRIVYFLDAGEFIKIGMTGRDLDVRVRELQTGNPTPLKIIGSIVIRDDEADHDLHRRFSAYHVRGEFFKKTPELLHEIDRLLRQFPVTLPAITFRIVHFARGKDCWFTCTCGVECQRCHDWFLKVHGDRPIGPKWIGDAECTRCGARYRLTAMDTVCLTDRVVVDCSGK